MEWVPRFFCCCRSQVFANSPFSQVFTSSPFSQEAPSPVEHALSVISIETLWTQRTALASSSSSLQLKLILPPAPPATKTQPPTPPSTTPLPPTLLPLPPQQPPPPPPPPQRSGGDVLVWPTNWDCDRWLTLTLLQFHPIILAMTADGVLRIVRVLSTLPPPPPTHTHTHTLSTPHTSARQCCRVVSTCATWHTYAYFQPYADLFYMHVVHLHTFIAVRWLVLHFIHMHTFFSRRPRSKTA